MLKDLKRRFLYVTDPGDTKFDPAFVTVTFLNPAYKAIGGHPNTCSKRVPKGNLQALWKMMMLLMYRKLKSLSQMSFRQMNLRKMSLQLNIPSCFQE